MQISSMCERAYDLVNGGIGKSTHLVVGAVLNGMRHEDPGRVEAKGARLRLRRDAELR